MRFKKLFIEMLFCGVTCSLYAFQTTPEHQDDIYRMRNVERRAQIKQRFDGARRIQAAWRDYKARRAGLAKKRIASGVQPYVRKMVPKKKPKKQKDQREGYSPWRRRR